MPFRRRRPIARMATTAVVAGTAAHMGAKSAQRSAAADQDQYQDQGILTDEEFAASKAKILGI